MDLSVIILSWNSGNFIERCIRSVVTSLAGSDLNYEIIVVDNGSTDGSPVLLRQLAREFTSRLIVQYLPVNFGTTVPRNIALKMARGEFLCIMDSDVEASAGVFPALIQQLEKAPSIGLIVPRIEYPNGRLQKSWDRFPTLVHKLRRFFRLRDMERQLNENRQELLMRLTVDYAISAFWLFHRKLLETVGLLDEKIFYSPEDVDYCLRIWKAGYRIVYLPSVSVVHHTQEISRGWKLSRSKFSHLNGLLYLFAKHRYFFVIPVFEVPQLLADEEAS